MSIDFAPQRALQPAALLTAAFNLLPALGVLAWGWDVFLVLTAFWFETAIIAFWTVLRIASMSHADVERMAGGDSWRPIPLALFFTAHSGIFMAVHFAFLWNLFSGEWPQRVHGIAGFFDQVVIRSGMWIALVLLFVGYGLNFLRQAIGLDPWRATLARVMGERAGEPAVPEPPSGAVLGRLYVRIIAMQFAILIGGLLALAFGSMGPLLVLIVLKTLIELVITTGPPVQKQA